MEGGELNCLFEILESSSPFWAPLNLDGTNYFLSPQNCNIINISSSPHQNADLQTWYKGPWTKTEDRKLKRLVSHYGRGNWSKVASKMPGRIGKQCRERWHNNLRPNIWKRTSWSDEEEMTIMEGHKIFGNRWSAIAKFLGGRSENDVKNRWHSIKRKQKSLKKIKRAKRLRHLYQSPILENYIKNNTTTHFLNTSSRAAAPPRPFTLTTTTDTRRNSITATAFIQPPIAHNNAPADAAATFTPPPFTIFTENYNAISPTFTPPPISTITENYETLIPNFFNTAAAATFTPPTPITENYNALSPTFSSTAAATLTPPPPMTENNALIATDVPLCVDDYDTDGIPYFAFESAAMDANSEVVQVQPYNLTSESAVAIHENLDMMYYDDLIGIRPCPIIGDAHPSETVDEEMDFMTSLFAW